VHADWLTSDDVTSRDTFTLNAAHFVDFYSTNATACLFVNSSGEVLLAVGRAVGPDGWVVSLVPGLDQLSSNYTFVTHRRQYGDDRRFQHFLSLVVERSSLANLVLDGRRLRKKNVTYVQRWTGVCSTRGRLVSAELQVDTSSAHRVYTADGRPFFGWAFGHNSRSAYSTSLAAVSEARRAWNDNYLWRNDYIQTTTTAPSSSVSTQSLLPTTTVAMETTGERYTTAADDDDAITTSQMTTYEAFEWTSTASEVTSTNSTTKVVMATANSTEVSSTQRPDNTTQPFSVVTTTVARQPTRAPAAWLSWATTASNSIFATSNYSTLLRTTTNTSRITNIDTVSIETRKLDHQMDSGKATWNASSSQVQVSWTSALPATSLEMSQSSQRSTIFVTSAATRARTSENSRSPSSSENDTQPTGAAIFEQTEVTPDYDDDDDDDDDDEYDVHLQTFELFKVAFVYVCLPFLCVLFAVWFFCSQTALRQRAKCHPATNQPPTSSSNDRAPATAGSFTSGDCTVVLADSSRSLLDAGWAPLTPAYLTTPGGITPDDGYLVQESSNARKKSFVTRSLDVDLLRRLTLGGAHRHRQETVVDVHCDKFGHGSGAGGDSSSSGARTVSTEASTGDRLYVETPPAIGRSRQKLQHMVSLPRASGSTSDSSGEVDESTTR